MSELELDPQVTVLKIASWLDRGQWYRALLEPTGSKTKPLAVRVEVASKLKGGHDFPGAHTEAQCGWRTVDHDSIAADSLWYAFQEWGLTPQLSRPVRPDDI